MKWIAILPAEFGQYLKYARTLNFEDQPDYDMLRGLMNKGSISRLIKMNLRANILF